MAYETADAPGSEDADDSALTPEQSKLIAEMKGERALEAQTGLELLRLRAREAAKTKFEEEESAGRAFTWCQVSHDDAFSMARERLVPDIGHMTKTPNSPPLPLFYSGKINGVHGDSEAGKSWLMQWVCVQEIRSGHHVLYIDFEDDAGGVYRRLLDLGASEDDIREFFHYVNPNNKLTVFERIGYQSLIEMDVRKSFAVVDGVTEAMSLENLTGRDEGEVARWHALVTKPLAARGWGVGMIDHTPHGENRVIGSQHKRSAITGVSYLLDPVATFARGLCGRSLLKVEKDRPGAIRAEAAPGARPQWYGTFVLDATLSYLQPAIWPGRPQAEAEEEKGYEERPPKDLTMSVWRCVRDSPGISGRAVRVAVKGRTEHVVWALEWLVDHEYVSAEKGRGTAIVHQVTGDYESDMASSGSQAVPSGSQDPGTTPQGSDQEFLND